MRQAFLPSDVALLLSRLRTCSAATGQVNTIGNFRSGYGVCGGVSLGKSIGLGTFWVVALLLLGCDHLKHHAARGWADLPSSVQGDATAVNHHHGETKNVQTVEQTSQNHAQRLAGALARRSSRDDETVRPVPAVQWIESNGPSPSPIREKKPKALSSRSLPAADSAQPKSVDGQRVTEPSGSTAQQGSQPDRFMDRRSLLTLLRKAVRTGDDPAMDKAIAAATLSLADPDRTLDPVDIEPLEPDQRRLVRRYHQLIVTLAQELASADGQLDADTILEHVNGLWGQRPIQIGQIELCRRVRGFGVYEPFESRVFLAAREQPMIVYTELKDFRATETAKNRYEVKLAQELVLYNESDGLAVWRQPKVDILDQSRNRRRDFFVVQMIRLPARLSVGKYLLKVRITDLASETLDESTIPIQLVADQALVAGESP